MDDVRWEAPEHTLAKIDILDAYLRAWTPIMSRRLFSEPNVRLKIIDGFAAAGRYAGGEEGSPLRALKVVLDHSYDFSLTPVEFTFIEKEPGALAALEKEIDGLNCRDNPRVGKIETINGLCQDELPMLISRHDGSFPPAFVFLDQFGYSHVPMNLVNSIMRHDMTECFIFLNWRHQYRYIKHEGKRQALDATYGCEGWREAWQCPDENSTMQFIRCFYKQCLRKHGNTRYVWDFAMADKNDKLIYWLFFCTNNISGLKEMKRAMWTVDKSGGFRFSDRDGTRQLCLFNMYSEDDLIRDILRKFDGETVTVGDIKEYVLTGTPGYNHAGAMQKMCKDGSLTLLTHQAGRRMSYENELNVLVQIHRPKPPPPKEIQLELFDN